MYCLKTQYQTHDYPNILLCEGCNKESEAFHCKSDVCIPRHAVRDGIRDCLGGEDELDGQ